MKTWHFIFLLLFVALQGCASLQQVDNVLLDQEVDQLHIIVPEETPFKIAILPFENMTESFQAAQIVRQAFYGHFSSLKYQDIELHEIDATLAKKGLAGSVPQIEEAAAYGKLLDAEGLIYGKISHFERLYVGVYSHVSVELEVMMVNGATGNIVWQAKHNTVLREGGLPFDPITAISNIIRTSWNIRDSQYLLAANELCRIMTTALPEPLHNFVRATETIVAALSNTPSLETLSALPIPEKTAVESIEIAVKNETDNKRELPLSAANEKTAPEHFMAGYEYYAAGSVDDAIVEMEKAVILDSDNPDYHYNLGLAYVAAGDRAKAEEHWRLAVELEPDHRNGKNLLKLYGAL